MISAMTSATASHTSVRLPVNGEAITKHSDEASRNAFLPTLLPIIAVQILNHWRANLSRLINPWDSYGLPAWQSVVKPCVSCPIGALEITNLTLPLCTIPPELSSVPFNFDLPYHEGLGAQEDASKQGRKIVDIDEDEEVTLVDETRGRNDENLMFDIGVFDEQEVEVEKVVSTIEVTTASATTTPVDELTLAQTLIEIKAAKPKAVTIVATITTTAVTRPKARGVVVQEPSEFTTTTSQPSQLPQAKDKGKEKMIEPKKPLKKKIKF
ncbi:hypothetical protein Tco_1289445 [Tanacetum coccineum]